jgi:hypothetical protein
MPGNGHTRTLGGDLGSPRGKELADFGAVVHVNDSTTASAWLGCPASTPINSDFFALARSDSLSDMNPKSRHRRGVGAVLITALLGAVLTSCSIPSGDQTNPTTTGSTSHVPASSIRVVMRFGDQIATATLADTPAARRFAAMLPLEVDLRDPMGQAKSGRLPSPIAITDAEPVLDPSVGGLYYHPPSQTFAIFYDHLGHSVPPPGLVPLGVVDGGPAEIGSAGNRFAVRVELADRLVGLPK